ncbi:hypothetical protein PAECIP111892_01763 [Paenibacillus auburnensis]|uniref:Tail assembly chaperone n=1 Tax=Paenibacillus auburnensis TaxID=2905649 RepID=A0ABM9BVV1_9BACL|nr:hypothetical protein [Paenibacillus auburnensis]CAH1194609.1 hypothetical protein PAECIP111892_01763 [Paenibacillus auburnensis]
MQLFKRSDKAVEPTQIDPNTVTLGGQAVKVRKVTIGQWRELNTVVGTLPQMLLSVVTAPAESRISYLLAVIESAIDDVINVVALLTGLEPAWIDENVSPDELMAYFVAVARVNDFGGFLKNVQGALNLTKSLDKAADVVMSAE